MVHTFRQICCMIKFKSAVQIYRVTPGKLWKDSVQGTLPNSEALRSPSGPCLFRDFSTHFEGLLLSGLSFDVYRWNRTGEAWQIPCSYSTYHCDSYTCIENDIKRLAPFSSLIKLSLIYRQYSLPLTNGYKWRDPCIIDRIVAPTAPKHIQAI